MSPFFKSAARRKGRWRFAPGASRRFLRRPARSTSRKECRTGFWSAPRIFQKDLPFPYVCPTTSKSYLKSSRDAMKRLLMALIEATHFYKTRKEESKKIFAKYSRQNNEAYLESAYQSSSKLFEQVPLVNRDGMDAQVKEAVARKPGAL